MRVATDAMDFTKVSKKSVFIRAVCGKERGAGRREQPGGDLRYLVSKVVIGE